MGDRTPEEDVDPLAPGLIHEMRHPLLGIKAGLQLIAAQLGAQVSDLEEWKMVSAQVTRLEELFRSYQAFLSPGPVVASSFPVAPVLQQAVDLLSFRLKRLGPQFSFAGTSLSAHAAPTALLHATTNLLVNALDAVEEAGGRGRIALRALTQRGRLHIRVSDEGTGVPAELKEKIFEQRFTTKAPGKGSGLGLGVARRMVEAAGGQVSLVDAADPSRLSWARTEFCIDFALVPEVTEPRSEPGGLRRKPTESGRAMVVEDEPAILRLLKAALVARGYQVTTATDGDAALVALSGAPFDLLVVDKNLPGASGVDVARQARAQSASTAIVVVTSYASSESALALQAIGVDAYLQKPFELDAFVQQVRLCIARRRAALAGGDAPGVDVLLVEPEPAERARLARLLGGLGHPVLARAQAGDELPGAAPLRAVVVSGRAYSPALQESLARFQAAHPAVKVILISDGQGTEALLAAICLGTVGHLTRPLSDEQLRDGLREALE